MSESNTSPERTYVSIQIQVYNTTYVALVTFTE